MDESTDAVLGPPRRWAQRVISALGVVALIGAGLWAVRPGDQVVLQPEPSTESADPLATPDEAEVAPPQVELQADGLWLSHHTISTSGQTILMAVVSPDVLVEYGVGGPLQRWEGDRWVGVGDHAQATPDGFDTDMDFASIGLGAGPGLVGSIERSPLPPLEAGWYRLVKRTSGGLHRAAFRVVESDEPIAPVVGRDGPELIVDPVSLAAADAVAGVPLALRRIDGGPFEVQQIWWTHPVDGTPEPPQMVLAHTEEPGPSFGFWPEADLAPGLWTITVRLADGEERRAHLPVVDLLAPMGAQPPGTDPYPDGRPAPTATASADEAAEPVLRHGAAASPFTGPSG